MSTMNAQKRAYLYACAVIVLWSTVASAFKISLRYLDYLQLLFFSSLVSTIVLFLLLVLTRKLSQLLSFSRRDLISSLVLGFLNPFLYYIVLFRAYSLLPAQEAQPLNQTWAIVLAIFSMILLKQRINTSSFIAIIVSFLGVVVIATHGAVTEIKFANGYGVLLALVSAFIWAIFWIYNVKDRRDEVVKLFLNFLFGFSYTMILLLVTHRLKIPGWQGLCGASYVGFFEMGLTFVLWLKALQLSETTVKISNLIYLVPFLSFIVIRLSIGESIDFTAILGLLLIVTGILIQQYRRKPMVI